MLSRIFFFSFFSFFSSFHSASAEGDSHLDFDMPQEHCPDVSKIEQKSLQSGFYKGHNGEYKKYAVEPEIENFSNIFDVGRSSTEEEETYGGLLYDKYALCHYLVTVDGEDESKLEEDENTSVEIVTFKTKMSTTLTGKAKLAAIPLFLITAYLYSYGLPKFDAWRTNPPSKEELQQGLSPEQAAKMRAGRLKKFGDSQ